MSACCSSMQPFNWARVIENEWLLVLSGLLILEIDACKRLPAVVARDEAGAYELRRPGETLQTNFKTSV